MASELNAAAATAFVALAEQQGQTGTLLLAWADALGPAAARSTWEGSGKSLRGGGGSETMLCWV